MLILALDSTAITASVAVCRDDVALATFFRHLVRNKEQDIVQFWQSNSGSLDLQMAALMATYTTTV